MPRYDTRLSGAGYELKRVFGWVWRWRVFPVFGDGTGLAWGRRGAMRAARSHLRALKPPRPICERPAPTLPVLHEPKAVRRPLAADESAPKG
jgi:hypothetical protein